MAAETGFMIDGALYEVPSWDTFTMDEAQVLYDYCGLTIEDLADLEDDEAAAVEIDEKMKNPGFTRALLHVAYQRGNPKLSRAKVQALVGSAQMLDALQPLIESLAVAADTEDDAGPPELTTEHEQQSQNGSVESNGSSGNGSEESSDRPAVALAPTTTSESATSSTSPPPSLVS